MDYFKALFYQWVPVHLQKRIKTLISFISGSFCLWLPVYRIETPKLKVTLIGRKSYDPYLVNLIYGEYLPCSKVATTLVWNITNTVNQWTDNSDLIIFRDVSFKPSSVTRQRMLNLPHSVSQLINLPIGKSDLMGIFKNTSVLSNISKIRKAGYSYYISRDTAYLQHFYQNMHKPFITNRHREAARVPSWPSFKSFPEYMDLLFVTKNGEAVAGALNLLINDCYVGYASGVLNAEPQLLKEGVVSAIYWFGVNEAHKRGCQTFDLGTSRAFLKDGVLSYKKKWDSYLVDNTDQPDFYCLISKNSPAIQELFEKNPLICKLNNRLISLIFLGQNTELNDKDLSSYLRACLFEGENLSTVIILMNQAWLDRQAVIETILKDYSDVTILDLSNQSLADLPQLIGNQLSVFR